MKTSLFIAAILTLAAGAAYAQGTTSGANSASSASVNSQTASGAQVNDNRAYYNDGDSTVRSAPAVSAPGVFGGGHPCLAGKSGGISVIGGGVSYGQGDPEPACMLWLMNQPEAALRVMAASSPKACRAMNEVGYIRIGEAIVPFSCTVGSRVRTGQAATVKPQERTASYAACYRENGVLHVTVKRGMDSGQAQADCRASGV